MTRQLNRLLMLAIGASLINLKLRLIFGQILNFFRIANPHHLFRSFVQCFGSGRISIILPNPEPRSKLLIQIRIRLVY
jgi:hypothetical protein